LQQLLQSHTKIHYFSRKKANQSIREKNSDCLFLIRVFICLFFGKKSEKKKKSTLFNLSFLYFAGVFPILKEKVF
jgi:hypothetical protein